jgi:hypothetical protein
VRYQWISTALDASNVAGVQNVGWIAVVNQ